MSISVSGNDVIFNGTVTVSNALDPTTGVCTLTLTPSGGVGNLPALVNGDPGQPAIFDSASVSTLSVGSLATVTLTQVSPGGAGVASHYTLAFGLPTGATGATGASGSIHGASDLSGSAVVGDVLTVSAISPSTAFTYSVMPWMGIINVDPTSFTPFVAPGVASSTVTTVSIAAQPYHYYPLCFATGTAGGTNNTQVKLTARLGSTTGNILGSTHTTEANAELSLIPSFGALLGSGYAQVPASTTASIYLVVSQVASTGDTWTFTPESFTVVLMPVA